MPWKFFTIEEFKCKGTDCCGGAVLMDDGFIDKLDRLRMSFGSALPVNSGYRCPIHNQRVSSTGPNGPHTTGRAVDLGVDRNRAYILLAMAMNSGDFTGIGFKQHGASRFLHIDDLQPPAHPRPVIWSYP